MSHAHYLQSYLATPKPRVYATMEGRKRKRGTAQPPDAKGLKRPHVVLDEVEDEENHLAKHLSRVGFSPQVCQAFIGGWAG